MSTLCVSWQLINRAICFAVLDALPESFRDDDRGITDSQNFVTLLRPQNPAAPLECFFVSKNHFPPSLEATDPILVADSPRSVHDDPHPGILRATRDEGVYTRGRRNSRPPQRLGQPVCSCSLIRNPGEQLDIKGDVIVLQALV